MDLERHILDVEAQPNHFLMCQQKTIPRAGLRRFPRQSDGRAQPALVVVSAARLRGHRPYGHDQRRADAQGPPHGRATRTRRYRESQGGPEAPRALVDSDHGDIYADWDIDQPARTLADVLSDEDE
jgi:hypothetical protein